jgi:hydroxymethylglutaryl-CoA lyase
MQEQDIFITECPRDAMQSWLEFIPSQEKIYYLQALLGVGYDVIDATSFVNPKLIPQLADAHKVLEGLDKSQSRSKISVIVANLLGVKKALATPNVDMLGYPFSVSEIFQHRNTNKSRAQVFLDVLETKKKCQARGKELLVYFSMAFGNPYGEIWNLAELEYWANCFAQEGITKIWLSDTIAVAENPQIDLVFRTLISAHPQVQFGGHFHSQYHNAIAKISTAYQAGCRSFDVAIKGLGGCPMAKDHFVGNMPTDQLINFIHSQNLRHPLNLLNYEAAYNEAKKLFKF